MELRVLQYFLAIAREQSIVRAAQSLHLSQPTLSTQIKNMEEELGKQLLIRGNKGSRKVTLTEEGMILRKRAEEILDLVRKTEKEITVANDITVGDIYIGAGETDAIRLIAKTAKKLQQSHPGIHYHISSGNSEFVTERLEKGLIDFGLVFTNIDLTRFDALKMPARDVWGVLMRKDSVLAQKESITPKDLWDKPLIFSQQEDKGGSVTQWIKRKTSDLNIAATYNLIFNASLMVDEGLGYAITFDRIINTTGDSNLCFRPLNPPLESEMSIIWKKYQVLSKPAEKFIGALQEQLYSDSRSSGIPL
ncbi:LysR family transcriptional regulator [Ruminococcus sp. OA3]|uniref:LysR family transcriptional regulator n=1 Tax=Ruminococcus sp. OA3 TaxID=2914164 RepID=UPI001F05F13B|nr:LysR family transcriptional regulator [Ruminococcus sp. OA3]MCH1983468.1 LysR family transcriptional regulator [Ruminococcus sp. OA3]